MSKVVRLSPDRRRAIVATGGPSGFALVAPGADVRFFDTLLAARGDTEWVRATPAALLDPSVAALAARALEVTAAAATRLDVAVTAPVTAAGSDGTGGASDAARRVYRVPAKVRAEAARGVRWAVDHGADPGVLSIGQRLAVCVSADVDFVAALTEQRLLAAPDATTFGYRPEHSAYPNPDRITAALLGGDPGAAWANKIARTHQLTLLSSAFVYDESEEYRAILSADPVEGGGTDRGTATGLLRAQGDDVEQQDPPVETPMWERRVPGAWEAVTPEDADALETVEIDQDSAEALAAWVDAATGEETFDLLNVNPAERNLFQLAAPHLDYVEIERAALLADGRRDGNYTPQERSDNVARQARATDGKFGGGSGAPPVDPGRSTTAFAKARLPGEMPLVGDVGALIDAYLAAAARRLDNDPTADSGDPEAVESAFEAANGEEHADAQIDPASMLAADTDVPPSPEGISPLYLALVDDVDTSAVLELVAVVAPANPGDEPGCYQRQRGAWRSAPDVLTALRSTAPPSVVEITDVSLVVSVRDQIDAYGAKDKAKDDVDVEAAPTPVAASAYFAYGRYGEMFPVYLPSEPSALTAGGIPGIADTPGDWAAVRRLRRYWSHGLGALKVRWGTPGDLTRCHRHLAKHMSSNHAWGYCFTGDTEFLTRDGVMTFAEAEGTDPFVLTANAPTTPNGGPVNINGRWVQAPVRSYGEQHVLTVTLTRNKITKTVRVTPEHTWFVSADGRSAARNRVGAVQTKDLQPGMATAALLPKTAVWRSKPSPIGIAAGFVYGDGHREVARDRGAVVDLWGDKDSALLPYFAGLEQSPTKTLNGVLGVRVRGLPASWKSVPAFDEGTTHLYGWLAGYFAADGSVSQMGAPNLYSAHRGSLEHAATVAARLGISTYGIKTAMRVGLGQAEPSAIYSLGFVATTVPPDMLVIPEHRQRFVDADVQQTPVRWRIVSVIDHGEAEEVFCAEVPDTETFALTDQVWVHNCQLRHRDALGTWNESSRKRR